MQLYNIMESISNSMVFQILSWAFLTLISIDKTAISYHLIIIILILFTILIILILIILGKEPTKLKMLLTLLNSLLLIIPFTSQISQITQALILGQQILNYRQEKIPILIITILLTIVLNINYQFQDKQSLEGFIGLQIILMSFTIEVIFNLRKYSLQDTVIEQKDNKLIGSSNLQRSGDSTFMKVKQEEDQNQSQAYKKQSSEINVNLMYESQCKGDSINQHSIFRIYHDEANQQEQHDLFAHLVNSFPDGNFILFFLSLSGVAILASNNEILYVNKQLKQLFKTQLNEKEVLVKLLGAKNCTEKFQEENQFKFLFEKLNEKYNYKDARKQFQFHDQLIGTLENISEFQYVEENSETVKDECQKQFQILIEEIDQSNRHFQFLEEKVMLCYIDENLSKSDEMSQSSNKQLMTVLEVFFKPYLRQNKPNLMLIVRDVSYFNQLKAMKTLNHNKSKMLSQVSHEFRTPLNCITLMVQSLMMELDQQKNEEYCEPILASINQLLSLVNDILDVAQLKAGKFKLSYCSFDLLQMIKGIQNLMKLPFKKKGVEFIIGEQAKPQIINSDENRVRQILLNLIGNAIKFTQRGSIKVSFRRLLKEVVQVTVKDTGIGINLEDQMKLFAAFGKLESSASQNLQGVGLGLMISNILAQKIGQPANISFPDDITRIQVSSEGENKGSTFQFLIYDQNYQLDEIELYQQELKRFQSEKMSVCSRLKDVEIEIPNVNFYDESQPVFTLESIRRKKPTLWFSNCNCKEILLVDDNSYNILALKTLLSKHHLKLDEANDGFECLNKLAQFQNDNICLQEERCKNFRILLMDIEMPRMDGIETTITIRRLYGNEIIIYGLSGYSDKEESEKCLQKGMNGYFTKPLKISDFLEHIKKYLNLIV